MPPRVARTRPRGSGMGAGRNGGLSTEPPMSYAIESDVDSHSADCTRAPALRNPLWRPASTGVRQTRSGERWIERGKVDDWHPGARSLAERAPHDQYLWVTRENPGAYAHQSDMAPSWAGKCSGNQHGTRSIQRSLRCCRAGVAGVIRNRRRWPGTRSRSHRGQPHTDRACRSLRRWTHMVIATSRHGSAAGSRRSPTTIGIAYRLGIAERCIRPWKVRRR